MNRRTKQQKFKTAGLVLASAALGMGAGVPISEAQTNVVVIITDDAGWGDFGFMDQVTGRTTPMVTPNLDALASSGVIFSHAYTGAVCAVSRASIATGQYGSRFGFENNILGTNSVIDSGLNQGLPVEVKTTFEHMKDLGYTTGVIGKWHLGAHQDDVQGGTLIKPGNQPAQQGVDEFFGLLSGGRSYFVGSQAGDGRLSTQTLLPNGAVNQTIVENQYSGAYVTDLLGEKSAQFIIDHATDADPFFLYHSFTSPHTPVNTGNVLASDYNDPRISGITNTNRRILAANMLAMDRAVGTILDTLDDPDGDGDNSDSIRNDTMVVFINDNGGDCCDGNGTNYANNLPLKNGKGTNWEGGIRVPMIIAGAGVEASAQGTIYDKPVHSIDITATAYEAAGGGSFAPTDTIDGVNLIPHINGTITDAPHESLFLRRPGAGQVAVRMGDWKLYHRDADGFLLFDVVNNPGETNDRAADFPQLVADMKRVMTDWEVQMDKNRVDNNADDLNQFNVFRFRDGAFTAANFSTTDAWIDSNNGAGGPATMVDLDSFSGMELVFRNRNNASYNITNDMTRNSGLSFMASRIAFIDRNETLNSDGTATIDGLPILLAKNALTGEMPELDLRATIDGPNTYTYDLAIDLELYDDLNIVGDGDQVFLITGNISEYRAGRTITKSGTSTVKLTGLNELAGQVRIEAGRLIADETSALGEADLHIAENATLEVTQPLTLGPGRTVTGKGTIDSPLVISGAQVSPGDSPGMLTLTGAYAQTADGTLAIEVQGTTPGSEHDVLSVAGSATLDGTLAIDAAGYTPQAGDSFTVLTADAVSGVFDSVTGVVVEGGMVLVPTYTADAVQLVATLQGDADGDGDIDDSDLGTLFSNYTGPIGAAGGKTFAQGDTDGDGDIDDSDLGNAFSGYTGPVATLTVPEPVSSSVWGATLLLFTRPRR